ncbi:hypothetical protein, partial [Pseudomonas syringae group genomosp. 7]|uniref:hypothetical protein n=1 Tax=Pseudomonas syringae group genomosp. 7 TaxID=251699 RepID=UPI00376FA28E
CWLGAFDVFMSVLGNCGSSMVCLWCGVGGGCGWGFWGVVGCGCVLCFGCVGGWGGCGCGWGCVGVCVGGLVVVVVVLVVFVFWGVGFGVGVGFGGLCCLFCVWWWLFWVGWCWVGGGVVLCGWVVWVWFCVGVGGWCFWFFGCFLVVVGFLVWVWVGVCGSGGGGLGGVVLCAGV